MTDKDFKTKIKTFSNKELLEQMDFMTEGYYSDLVEVCLEELRCRLEATKWHYPSKGEYPKEKELVLMKIPGCYALGWFRDNKWFFDMKHDQFTKLDVLRWQYIIPPKEEA